MVMALMIGLTQIEKDSIAEAWIAMARIAMTQMGKDLMAKALMAKAGIVMTQIGKAPIVMARMTAMTQAPIAMEEPMATALWKWLQVFAMN